MGENLFMKIREAFYFCNTMMPIANDKKAAPRRGAFPVIARYLSLVKFSHTIFALPFALVGFSLGVLSKGPLEWRTLGLVLMCMVFARSAAMAFNRYLDRGIDRQNPRTAVREIPAGVIAPRAALAFALGNSLLFMLCAWFINPLCFILSPVALLIILGYSYTKRFTFLCHFILGLGLSLAPLGAFLAVTGRFDILPVLYGLVVLLWVSGFDIIYALQDEDFDRSLHLRSVPVKMGRARAMALSGLLHGVCGLLVVLAAVLQSSRFEAFEWLHWVGVAVFTGLLVYQHAIISVNDLSRIGIAFFTTNGIASLIFGVFVIVDVWW
jgi:4-hydroxybenzoate polyprenyltransferase